MIHILQYAINWVTLKYGLHLWRGPIFEILTGTGLWSDCKSRTPRLEVYIIYVLVSCVISVFVLKDFDDI
jgi:hypothetical protein